MTVVVDECVAAWNERDADQRAALRASACTDEVRHIDPETDVTGFDACRCHRKVDSP